MFAYLHARGPPAVPPAPGAPPPRDAAAPEADPATESAPFGDLVHPSSFEGVPRNSFEDVLRAAYCVLRITYNGTTRTAPQQKRTALWGLTRPRLLGLLPGCFHLLLPLVVLPLTRALLLGRTDACSRGKLASLAVASCRSLAALRSPKPMPHTAQRPYCLVTTPSDRCRELR